MKITGATVTAAFHEAGNGSEPVPMPIITEPSAKDEVFPIHIYPPEIQASFIELADQYSIPLGYLGLTGLFVIAGMAGNMYYADMLGNPKPIIYACLVGPSGVGKTPAYKHLCDYIIAPLMARDYENYKIQDDAYRERLAASKSEKSGIPFTEKPPVKKLRTITDGTLEAITMHAETNPAGFAIIYDEGERFFSGANAYKKDTSAVGFWNEMWNGQGANIIRADSTKDRHITNAAISVFIGLQKDRLLKFFNEDTIASGLLNRFLICESDYIKLNEKSDPFNMGISVSNQWSWLVSTLYRKGMNFVNGESRKVPFTPEAVTKLRVLLQNLVIQSNRDISALKEGDGSKLMIAYASKLYAYVPRLAVTLAIMRNVENPEISVEDVDNAHRLHQYFKATAKKVLGNISDTTSTGMDESHMKFINALPSEFTNADAAAIAKQLNYSDTWFAAAFRRKTFNGWIEKTERGKYRKC